MRCTREYYNDMLECLSKAFGENKNWFQRNCGHVVPFYEQANDTDFNNHFIHLEDGRVAGVVGSYLMDFDLLDVRLSAAGIGQVSCLPEYRGKGIMSSLIKEAITDMESSGTDISVLGGDRFRYAHFGYEFGGIEGILYFDKNRIETPKDTYYINEPRIEDISMLRQLYERLPSRVYRSDELFERHLLRGNVRFVTARLETCTHAQPSQAQAAVAYLAYKPQNPSHILEISGDTAALPALLHNHFAEHGIESIRTYMPVHSCEVSRYLYSICSYYEMRPAFNIKIVNPNSIIEKFAHSKAFNPIMKALPAITDDNKEEICRRLLGFTLNPCCGEVVTQYGNAGLWCSELDHV